MSDGEGEDKSPSAPAPAGDVDGDELAEIDGIKPNKLIKDGEEVEAKSMTRCVPETILTGRKA
jgi:hypothetical protein